MIIEFAEEHLSIRVCPHIGCDFSAFIKDMNGHNCIDIFGRQLVDTIRGLGVISSYFFKISGGNPEPMAMPLNEANIWLGWVSLLMRVSAQTKINT
jgi:hypothetical protein